MEKVCVLLSTYNGEQYLDEQIQSLFAQKGVDLTILVRDDGSKDGTDKLLRGWAEKKSSIRVLEENYGKNLGVARSFVFLLNNADVLFPDTSYFFFCDQDDVWLDGKCLRAVNCIRQHRDKAALYFSSKILVNSFLEPLKQKDSLSLHGTFWDYFDRSNAFGCTMCMTRPLIELLRDDAFYDRSFLHDNYIYRFCLAAGIPIFGDCKETILYRQHGANVAGAAKRNLFRGVRKIFVKNRAHPVREMTEYLLENHRSILQKENAKIMQLFLASGKSLKSKLKIIKLYRKQKNRGLKDKLVFDLSILLEYY